MLGAMAAMLVAALATPHAFGDDAIIFGLAYAGRTLAADLHLGRGQRAGRYGPSGPPLPGPPSGAAASHRRGLLRWRRPSRHVDHRAQDRLRGAVPVRRARVPRVAGHFAERYGLIVIIALGESIVAIGAGIAGVTSTPASSRRRFGIVAVGGALVGVLRRHRRHCGASLPRHARPERAWLARDSYSYLHLPMIAGILLVALGVKKTLDHVDEPLKTMPQWPCSAGSRSTTSRTSPSACAMFTG